jgi:hypothetical protein
MLVNFNASVMPTNYFHLKILLLLDNTKYVYKFIYKYSTTQNYNFKFSSIKLFKNFISWWIYTFAAAQDGLLTEILIGIYLACCDPFYIE